MQKRGRTGRPRVAAPWWGHRCDGVRMKSLLTIMLLACLTDEQLKELAAVQVKKKHCDCLPEVRDRRPDEVAGLCWNCGKPQKETST